MVFLRFIFSFLYVRNWHTGRLELSNERLALFAAAVFLVLLALALISFLQAPVSYSAAAA